MQRNSKIVLLIFMAVFLAVPLLAVGGTVYRWVDESGKVHYGDRAPEGVTATRVDINPNTVDVVRPEKPAKANDGGGTDTENVEEPELSNAEQSRQDRAARRAENAEKAQRMAIDCETMRQQRDFVEPNPRVIVDDGKGGVRRLDDNEREELLNQAKTFLAKNCNT